MKKLGHVNAKLGHVAAKVRSRSPKMPSHRVVWGVLLVAFDVSDDFVDFVKTSVFHRVFNAF